MAHKIIDLFKSLELTKPLPPIPLPWKEVPLVITLAISDSHFTVAATRTSGWTRKQPTTRADFFYGQCAYPQKYKS
jgi:hypothetical protein